MKVQALTWQLKQWLLTCKESPVDFPDFVNNEWTQAPDRSTYITEMTLLQELQSGHQKQPQRNDLSIRDAPQNTSRHVCHVTVAALVASHSQPWETDKETSQPATLRCFVGDSQPWFLSTYV